MAKPTKTLELHYQMIQFLIMYYIICLRHCAPMTANFVEISNALESTWNKQIHNKQKMRQRKVWPSQDNKKQKKLQTLKSNLKYNDTKKISV